MLRPPRDLHPYRRHPQSRPAVPGLTDGLYVYVQDAAGLIHVAPDGQHMHPKVLGGARLAMYAGDMTVHDARVVDFTNLSGTFQFDDIAGLLAAAEALRCQGLVVNSGAVRFFGDGSARPVVIE